MILDQIKEAQQRIKIKRAEQGIAMNYQRYQESLKRGYDMISL
jgi:hypothetical protein